MDEETLAAIRQHAVTVDGELGTWYYPGSDESTPSRQWLDAINLLANQDIPALLVEVERLRAREAALRDFVFEASDQHEHRWVPANHDEAYTCAVCFMAPEDYATDIQTRARALLAGES
jgi:hypothetical protein